MLTVLCAHRAEAASIIEYQGLSRSSTNPSLFEGEGMRLLITGQGTARCEDTLHRLAHRLTPVADDFWFNFGVAGAGNPSGWPAPGPLRAGSLVAIDRLSYRGCSWQLQVPRALWGCADTPGGIDRVGRCITVDAPESGFKEAALFDMEAGAIALFLQQRRLAGIAGGRQVGVRRSRGRSCRCHFHCP